MLVRKTSKDLASVLTEIVLERGLTGVFSGSFLGDGSLGEERSGEVGSNALRSSGLTIEAVSIARLSWETCFLCDRVSDTDLHRTTSLLAFLADMDPAIRQSNQRDLQ